jgi:2-polyprenyl-3-methyl-5-hydroxy-6-metoxy-1,4-benzoquinol methylase
MKTSRFDAVRHPDGWVSASPLPEQAELQSFYADLYYQSVQSATYQPSYDDLDLRHKALRCDTLLHALKDAGLAAGDRFLDIGAGEGFLMDAADRSGLAVTGLDYSSFGVEKFFPRLRDRLVAGDVIDLLEQLAKGHVRFAACSAINVLEHVLDPAHLLASVAAVLAPGGLVAVTVPNDYSRLQQLLRDEGHIDRDFWFSPPQHLQYFNAENLPRFCAANGFEVVDGFSDFPIDLYLFHPGSNYVLQPANGPAAHRSRLLLDLLMAERGMAAYLQMYRALFGVGIGRNITVILRAAAHTR